MLIFIFSRKDEMIIGMTRLCKNKQLLHLNLALTTDYLYF